MDNKEFDKLFDSWKKKKLQDIEGLKPPKSNDCLCFTELETCAKSNTDKLTSTQKQHIHSCSYCQKMIATFEKVMQEEKQVIPIYERFTHAVKNLVNALAPPFKAFDRLISKVGLPRLMPALAPVLAVILIFIIFTPLFNPSIELKKYSFEFAQPSIVTRGSRSAQEIVSENRFKIRLAASHNCYVYLFSIERDKANLLLQEKVMRKVENTLPKEGWLEGEGKLILLLTKKPLKDISFAQEIIIKNYVKGENVILRTLKNQLKRKDVLIRILVIES